MTAPITEIKNPRIVGGWLSTFNGIPSAVEIRVVGKKMVEMCDEFDAQAAIVTQQAESIKAKDGLIAELQFNLKAMTIIRDGAEARIIERDEIVLRLRGELAMSKSQEAVCYCGALMSDHGQQENHGVSEMLRGCPFSKERDAAQAKAERMESQEAEMRLALAINYSTLSNLYTGDGELQDSRYPAIDWKRDSWETIKERMAQRTITALARLNETIAKAGGEAEI